ncbi:unnamed protein product [Enterobius vermicularis]|uniref:OTU domain-containing protein n=1 Tax=Enterobius vermicularis TaxID=51028 RepID=A0A0N4VLN7_ENTVE|nr:unnamed protein product [Enterobius vermicularis]
MDARETFDDALCVITYIPWKMARKKEYSIVDGCAKKRTAPSFSSVENISKTGNNKGNPNALKRKDSNNRAGPSCPDVYDVADLRAQLRSIGLTLRDIPGDGNCLFRALGDQLEGHSRNHLKHRADTVRYMIANRKHFEPFIDIPFERYTESLGRSGTYAGQDALVAFAKLHKVNIVIHQLNSPLWQIEGSENENARELHLSYHNGEHYSSVRCFGDKEGTPADVRLVSLMASCRIVTFHKSFDDAQERPCVSLGKNSATGTQVGANGKEADTSLTPSYAKHKTLESAPLAIPEAVNDDSNYIAALVDFDAVVSEVMMRSNCGDRTWATQALIENNYDVEQTVKYLFSPSVKWEETQKDKSGKLNDALFGSRNTFKAGPLTNTSRRVVLVNFTDLAFR